MKKNSVSLLFGLISMALLGQDNRPISIYHLTDNFYVYTTYKNLNGHDFPSNSMYLVTDEGTVMFDTPWDTTQLQPLLDSIWVKHHSKVIMAIATHYHNDRTAGLGFLQQQGIKTYSSRMTYDLCHLNGEQQAGFYFEQDTIFKVGDYLLETYYAGEGHSPDNIVIWFANAKILYGGCLVKSIENNNLGNVVNANIKAWTPTIRKLIRRYSTAHFVVPGHFGWANTKALRHTLRLLRQYRKVNGG